MLPPFRENSIFKKDYFAVVHGYKIVLMRLMQMVSCGILHSAIRKYYSLLKHCPCLSENVFGLFFSWA